MSAQDFARIPIVDVSLRNESSEHRQMLADELTRICHEVGFFVATGHGIEAAFLDDVFAMMAQFFAFPEEDKRRIDKIASPQFRGWESVGSEYTNNRPDIREQIDLWSDWPARAPDVEPGYLRLLGPNQHIPDDLVAGAEALSREWFDRMGALARELMELLALGLGLDEKFFLRFFGDEPMSLTKFISYPPTPAGQAGVNAHHDAGFLTVLAPGKTPGLEVQSPTGDWIPVVAPEGGLVINLGEIFQAMTGNYFVATPHRVITGAPRLSAAYFHGPSLDTSLEALPLDDSYHAAVEASPRHRGAGFMARREETVAGVGDMASDYKPAVYGEQLWNYFQRSYPDNMARHHPS